MEYQAKTADKLVQTPQIPERAISGIRAASATALISDMAIALPDLGQPITPALRKKYGTLPF